MSNSDIGLSRWLRAIPLGLAILLAGCEDRPRYPISGRVTYNGKPVPAGSIVFVPDRAGGNSGASAVAEIKNGTYSAEAEVGIFGGPYLIRVNGTDGVPARVGEGGVDDRGKPIFPQFEKAVDLPEKEHVLDIDVHPSAPRAKPGGGSAREQG